ncbi:hypothetical protein COU60_02690 [Candidatus Pacearchaeota archaeon CG10_big_fil_rev_8_21_14_0_10_34_76]|nr:MAG: hypothetical protein COU60_02690 [Candidatus Pacearchaeota archaeon CG10_big_fil_rev_8_21_14_0_10_34_76]
MKFFPKSVDNKENVHILLLSVIRATLLIAMVAGVVNQNWLVVFVASITLSLTFLPFLFEKSFKIDIPIEFELAIVIFIYATLFLGESQGYYTKFWGWDLILHAGSAIERVLLGTEKNKRKAA